MGRHWRIGLIGVGRWGAVYVRTLEALRDRCALTHLCTRHPEKAAGLPYPVTVVPTWRALIEAECDAAIIASPPDTHAEILEACLAAGKPCIVEKPLCLDVPTAERLHARAEERGVPVLVDHTQLFSGAYRALKRAVAAQGEPIRRIVSEGGAFGPFQPVPALWDWAPHDVSLCLDLLGKPPVRVDAVGGVAADGSNMELVAMSLQFADGPSAWIHTGRLLPSKRRMLSVHTDQRVFLWDDLAPQRLTVRRLDCGGGGAAAGDAWEPTALPLPIGPSAMESMVAGFLDGLEGGDRSRFGTRLALDVVRVLGAAEAAMRRGTASESRGWSAR